MKLKTVVNDGGSVSITSTSFDLEVSPVASSVTISPTQTFEDAYDWTDINLNANMTDLDGSETLTVTLSGQDTPFDSTALFRLADGTIINGENDAPTATFDEESGSWTLEGIPSSEINNIEMLYHDYSGSVDVLVRTIDGDSGNENATLNNVAEGSFDMNISGAKSIDLSDESEDLTITASEETNDIIAGSGDDIISYSDSLESIDSSEGYDTLMLHDDEGIDFTMIENIEEINLDNQVNQELTIELDDLVHATDNDNELVIKGNNGDVIDLSEDKDGDGEADWKKESTSDKDGFDHYTNTTDCSVNLYIDQEVDIDII